MTPANEKRMRAEGRLRGVPSATEIVAFAAKIKALSQKIRHDLDEQGPPRVPFVQGNAMILNVTPAEFNEISIAALEMTESDFAAFMCSYYGCERYTSYRVVVHRNAPCIPMVSWDLKRIEKETP